LPVVSLTSCRVNDAIDPAANPASGLVAYYPFNNGNTNDSSGFGHNGVAHNTTLTPNRFGTPNSAIAFDGISSYIDIPGTSNLNLTSGGMTLCAWVLFQSQDVAAILIKNPYGTQAGYGLCVGGLTGAGGWTPNSCHFYYPGGGCGTGIDHISSPQSYADGKWHFVVGTYDRTTSTLFVDGIAVQSTNNAYTCFDNVDDICIGSNAGAYSFLKGSIDHIRIYNRPLTQAEITALYNEK